MKKNINYPENVIKIARILQDNGFKAYAVGGCMRDSVMGKCPADWDMTTDASPEQMLEIFSSLNIRTIPTGLKHGTVSVLLDGEIFECTTFRIDGEYTDSRHPSSVEFTKDIKYDLCRRDFTMNALAGSPSTHSESEIIDLFGGLSDILSKTVRSVGDAEVRFTEDALRILRAVRFATVLDFEIEESTKKAAIKLASRLADISAERKNTELEKILLSDHADRGISLLLEMGLAKHIHPEIQYPKIPLHSLPKHFAVRFAALMGENSHPDLSQMKLSGANSKQIKLLCDKSLYDATVERFEGNPYASARMMLSTFESLASQAALLRENLSLYEAIEQEKKKNPCVKISDLAVSGSDLLSAGAEAKTIGKIMQYLLISVIEFPEKNEKAALLALATEFNGV